MNRIRSTAIAGAIAGSAALVPVIASASASHAKTWDNKALTVTCGIEIHTGPKATEVLCSSPGVPAPKHTTSAEGDPGFVQLAAKGSPKTLRLSQNSFVQMGNPTTLGHGVVWSSLGVTCNTGSGKTVLCFNGDNHGFVIGNGHYTSF
jgi:hypothetical protein